MHLNFHDNLVKDTNNTHDNLVKDTDLLVWQKNAYSKGKPGYNVVVICGFQAN